MQQDHFKYIFWYIVGTTAVVFAYIIIITFMPIPKENLRFADTSQGFLLGSMLGAGAAYLWGGSPLGTKPTPKPGTTNLELTSTSISDPGNNDTNPADTSGVTIQGFKQKNA